MRSIGFWSAALVLASLGSAFAEGIPAEVIAAQHASCVASCTKSSGGRTAACERACGCIDSETQKQFTLPEFTELARQIAANPDAPNFTPEIKTKLDAVFAACLP